MTPNTIHFIYPVTPRTRPWSLVNHASVMLARKIHNPDKIIIWTNADPKEHFTLLRTASEAGAVVQSTELPTEIDGVKIEWPQYMADVMRLQILLKYGGIYMDTDILLRAPLDAHLAFTRSFNTAVISWESVKKASVCNALMIAPPNNDFLAEWLRRIPEALQSPTWAQGGVVLPAEIAANSNLRLSHLMLDPTFACPLDLSKPWLFDPSLREEAANLSGKSHAIHVFESYWRNIIKDIDYNWLERTPCLFSDIFNEIKG